MKKLKHIYLLTAIISFIIVSCNNNHDKEADENCPASFELKGLDTVNVITCHGKQGKWVPSISNDVQDTTYYRNDTIIER
jgi:hypothetical protein